METKQDLQKLTVPQLKEKLKQRHLTTSGTKSELVDRLIESIQEEEKLLVGTEATEDLDVDDLLGTNEPSLTSNEEALLLGLPAKAVPKQTDAPKVQAPKPTTPTVVPAKPATQETPAKPEISSPKNGSTTDKPADDESASKRTREPIRPKISTDNSDDAKKRRAERFGIPVKSTEEKPLTATTNTSETTTASSEKPALSLNSNSKLLERAKRFGLPVQQDSSGGDTSEASKPKIARITVSDQDEAKQRRLKRFAQT